MAQENLNDASFRFASPHREKLFLSILVGAIIYFILVVFEPFELGQYSTPYIKAICLGYAFNTIVTVYVFERYVHRYLTGLWKLPKWGVIYNTIHVLLPILINGIINGFYNDIAFGDSPLAPGFWKVVWYTFLVGILPALAILFWNYTSYQQRRRSRQHLPLVSKPRVIDNSFITISSTVSSDRFNVRTSKIILCSALGNYVSLYCLTDDGVQRHTSRKTISSLVKELPEGNFIRCHRSHIVNMEYALKKEGNAKGLKLTIDHLEDKVQVSRQYVPAVRQWLAEHSMA